MIKPVLILLFILIGSSIAYADATTNKLLTQSDLTYLGAFRVPQGKYGNSNNTNSLSYGGQPIAYNPINNSLFIVGHSADERMLMEIGIPALINSANISGLNTSSVIQQSIAITDGQWDNLKSDGTTVGANTSRPGGMLVHNGKLIGTSYIYYDAASPPAGVRSHYTANLDWSVSTGYSGMFRVGVNPTNAAYGNGGFVGGYLASIPSDWQSLLGGAALTGLGAISILDRSSAGPSAWVFDPSRLGVDDPVSATMLVGYDYNHQTIGTYTDQPSIYYNRATEVRGAVFPYGTRSVLFFGRHGYGVDGVSGYSCYGTGTNNIDLDNTFLAGDITTTSTSTATISSGTKSFVVGTGLSIAVGAYIIAKPVSNPNYHIYAQVAAYNSTTGEVTGTVGSGTFLAGSGTFSDWTIHVGSGASGDYIERLCYDPSDTSHGSHAYPYTYRVWSYDANDLLAVKNGTKTPASMIPSVWDIALPFASDLSMHIVGAAYDSINQRIYVAQASADRQSEPFPVIHAFSVNTGSGVTGSCGTANGGSFSIAPSLNLCAAGTPSAVSGTGPWAWTCAGSGGGTTASCSASLASQARSVSIKLGSGGKMTGILR